MVKHPFLFFNFLNIVSWASHPYKHYRKWDSSQLTNVVFHFAITSYDNNKNFISFREFIWTTPKLNTGFTIWMKFIWVALLLFKKKRYYVSPTPYTVNLLIYTLWFCYPESVLWDSNSSITCGFGRNAG